MRVTRILTVTNASTVGFWTSFSIKVKKMANLKIENLMINAGQCS